MGKGRALNLLQDTTTVANYVRVRLPPCFFKRKNRPGRRSKAIPGWGNGGKRRMSSPLSISIFGPSSSPVLSHPVPKASSLIPFSPFATDRLSVPEAVTERFHPTSLWHYYIRALMRVLLLLLFHIPSLSSSSPFRYIESPPPRLSRLSADFRPPSLRLAAGGDPKPLSRLPPPPSSLHFPALLPPSPPVCLSFPEE